MNLAFIYKHKNYLTDYVKLVIALFLDFYFLFCALIAASRADFNRF